jgi:UDP-2,4-diacetamido-2,4,6-trideoxy-beta-L-altropyranose hydrolase
MKSTKVSPFPPKIALLMTGASPEIGGGHVLRCLSLAESLEEHDFHPVFVVTRTTVETVSLLRGCRFDILEAPENVAISVNDLPTHAIAVFDGYDWDWRREIAWRGLVPLRIVIDDLADRRHDCEVLVDQTPGRQAKDYGGLVPDQCEIFAGPEFALLRPEFRRYREAALNRRSGGSVQRLLISMGLTDIQGITRRVVEGAMNAGLDLEIDVAISVGAESLEWLRDIMRSTAKLTMHVDTPDMARLMVAADLAIGAGGSTSLERCCMGLPSLVVVLAENQRIIVTSLERIGAIKSLGDATDITSNSVAAALKAIVADDRMRMRCAQIAASLVDGAGADRLCRALVRKLR